MRCRVCDGLVEVLAVQAVRVVNRCKACGDIEIHTIQCDTGHIDALKAWVYEGEEE
jgi:hypothetical protein